MKYNLVTVTIILAIIALMALFGTLMVESNAQMHHAVNGVYKYSQGGIVFLTIVLTCMALFASYFVIKVRNDDLALKLKSEQRNKKFKEFLAQLNKV